MSPTEPSCHVLMANTRFSCSWLSANVSAAVLTRDETGRGLILHTRPPGIPNLVSSAHDRLHEKSISVALKSVACNLSHIDAQTSLTKKKCSAELKFIGVFTRSAFAIKPVLFASE